MKKILFGAAYYDEYMPEERLEKDMQMMKKAGFNVIRIAESTWASEEPSEGVFDFSHVRRSLEAANRYGLSVIVGTPTYAIPPWLAKRYPEVIADTEQGPGKYGTRQNMDITNPHYRYYAERVIRKLMECVQEYPNVIGFQLDNETKHHHTAGKHVQELFVEYLKDKFGTVEALNREFGFAYWSNAVDCWENVPDVTGTINGSFWGEFEKFRRTLVDEFLMWQRKIIDEYRREDQFVTHNFDFEWREYSFGVQPDVNHCHASEALSIAGCDIYHKTQDELTGKEIAFCGASTRSLKNDNYLVLETEAQGHLNWTPFDGQLRLQAFSHIASGANGVMYWHWHSIHNSFETYWRGLLSHDMEENRPYREAVTIGEDLSRIGDRLVNQKKENQTAILISNESLTALGKLPMFPLPDPDVKYNDVVRRYADALYELNIEYDVISAEDCDFTKYKMIVVPVLYSASDDLLHRINAFIENGGLAVVGYKSGYANEYVTVSHEAKPHILHESLGISYQEFTVPRFVKIKPEETAIWNELSEEEKEVSVWMEFVESKGAKVLASYEHPYWGKYVAVTENTYGKGTGIYAGCHLSGAAVKALMKYAALKADADTQNAINNKITYPVIVKSGTNQYEKKLRFIMNYSGEQQRICYPYGTSTELITGKSYKYNDMLTIEPWGFCIMEEEG